MTTIVLASELKPGDVLIAGPIVVSVADVYTPKTDDLEVRQDLVEVVLDRPAGARGTVRVSYQWGRNMPVLLV